MLTEQIRCCVLECYSVLYEDNGHVICKIKIMPIIFLNCSYCLTLDAFFSCEII